MTLAIAALVVTSAILHPLWNLLLKGDTDRSAAWCAFSFMLALIGGVYCLATGQDFLSIHEVWPWVLLSWIGQMTYGLALIRIYEKGDLSAYYPIVRASPIGVAALGFVFLGNTYGAYVLAGIALSVVGAFWLQKQPGKRLLDDPRTLAFAVLSMSGTAIYSIADSAAVTKIAPAVMFFWVEIGLTFIYPVVMTAMGHRQVIGRAAVLLRTRFARQACVAVLGYASYALILEAYSQGGDVAAVTTIRQISIPVSVLLGGMVLKEAFIGRRFGASLLLVAGIVLVILGA